MVWKKFQTLDPGSASAQRIPTDRWFTDQPVQAERRPSLLHLTRTAVWARKSVSASEKRPHSRLVTPQVQSVPECTLEVEGRRRKLRIQLKGASASDLASLSRVLWEVAS